MYRSLKLFLIVYMLGFGHSAIAQYQLDTFRNGKVKPVFHEKDEIKIYADKNTVDTLWDNITDSKRVIKNVHYLVDTSDLKDSTKKHIFVGVPEDPGLYRIKIQNDRAITNWNLFVYGMPHPYEKIKDLTQLFSILKFENQIETEEQKAARLMFDSIANYISQYIKRDAFEKKINDSARAISAKLDTGKVFDIALLVDTGSMVGVIVTDEFDSKIIINELRTRFNTVLSVFADTLLYKDTLSIIDTIVTNVYLPIFGRRILIWQTKEIFDKIYLRDKVFKPFNERCKKIFNLWLTSQINKTLFIKQDPAFVSRNMGLNNKTPGITYLYRKKYFGQLELYVHLCNVIDNK